MECNEPGAIRDEELLAYLVGDTVRPVVLVHLGRCQRCSSQLAEYRRIELKLTSKLFRWDCPPNQILGEYQLGMLSNELATAVNFHLSQCVLCAAEVADLKEFLLGDPLLVERTPVIQKKSVRSSVPVSTNHRAAPGAKGFLEQMREQSRAGIRRIAAVLLPPPPRLVPIRGVEATTWPRRYTAEDLRISLQVQRETHHGDTLQLIGLVSRNGSGLNSLDGTPVVLSPFSSASAVYTQKVDELGNFVFASIPPATYTLELQLPNCTIVVDQFPLVPQE